MAFVLEGYIDVAERIRLFKKAYPDGSLQPANLDKPFEIVTADNKTFIVYVAAAYRTKDDPRPGVGVAWEPFPGKTNYTRDSELMNAETSAWGRAIVAALAADTQKIASLEEVRNRADERAPQSTGRSNHPSANEPKPQRTREQMIADANAKSDALRAKQESESTAHPPAVAPTPASNVTPLASATSPSAAQKALLGKLARERGVSLTEFATKTLAREIESIDELTKRDATQIITALTNMVG
jgi:hypothetical protein